jgi:hypothetical protein
MFSNNKWQGLIGRFLAWYMFSNNKWQGLIGLFLAWYRFSINGEPVPSQETSDQALPLVIGEPVPSQEMSNEALITRRKWVPCKWMMTRSLTNFIT